jgi:N-acetylmuramoyl-L-alanine amidase
LAPAALLAAILLAAGCNQGQSIYWEEPRRAVEPPVGSMPVRELAAHLKMTVADSSVDYVCLKDGINTVSIYADPCGQAYVNGQAVGQRGGIVGGASAMYVPQTLEPQIRMALRRTPIVTSRGPGGEIIIGETTRQTTKVTQSTNIRPARASGRVVIDPGHGGSQPGAHTLAKIGGRQVEEKEINLAIGLGVARALRSAGVEVILTREGDSTVSLEDRYQKSNASKCDLFVSIHCDSLPPKPGENGYAVWVAPKASAATTSAAQYIRKAMAATGGDDRGTRENTYQVLINNSRPAVLIETGFLSNNAEAARLASPSYQSLYAEAIADGIISYLASRRGS